jgi:outer membrane lipoprotein carrier protein
MGSGKFWRRRLRPPISVALAFLALLPGVSAQSVLAQAEHRGAPQVSASGVARLEAFLDDVRTLTADFEQELWSAERELLQTDMGSLSLERPNRFRWTYRDPHGPDGAAQLVVVADGARLWIYDVELDEVTVTPFEEVGTSPAMLLSGGSNVREQFDVVQAMTLDGLDWIKLEPKSGSDFTSVSIGFLGAEPRRLELVDGLGQVTRIVLRNLVVNPEIDDDVFVLDVPPGAHVIGEG